MKTLFIVLIIFLQVWPASDLTSAELKKITLVRPQPVSVNFFGLHIHRAHTTTRWPKISFGSWRLWDSYLKWSDIQPSPNEWKFDAFDRQVHLGREHGKELIYTLGQTPRWASSMPDEKHAWGIGTGAMPRNIDDWQHYVKSVVTRYKGKIAAYEVWNEPKFKERGRCSGAIFFCGDPEGLVTLTRTAYETIKSIDPSAKLASPAFTGGLRGVEHLDKYLAAGGAKYIEVISFHFYELAPEKTIEAIIALEKVMYKHGLSSLPIWNSEVGYLIQNQEGTVVKEHEAGPFSRVLTEYEAAERLIRIMAISAAAGMDRVHWYAWDDKRMGLIGSKDGFVNATGIAYEVAMRWLVNSAIKCNISLSGGRWTCELNRDGRAALLVWHTGPKGTRFNFQIPGKGKRVIEDYQGNAKTVTGGEVLTWDGSPVLVVQDSEPWLHEE